MKNSQSIRSLFALSVRYIQVESSGAPSVQRDQQELGRALGYTSRQLPDKAVAEMERLRLLVEGETILKYIRTTTTSSGLRVRAHLIRRRYPKGVKITDERMQALSASNTSLQRTRLYPNGTTPSEVNRLENGNLFCRRPLGPISLCRHWFVLVNEICLARFRRSRRPGAVRGRRAA